MDNAISQEWLNDAQAIVTEIGQTIVINGTSYSALVGEPTITQSFVSGGLMDMASILVKIPATTSALSAKTHMAHGKTITFDGRTFRINSYSHKPGTAWITIQVNDADQR